MNESSQPRFVIGLIVLAILCTVALGIAERRSAPLAAYSRASPLGTAPRMLHPQGLLRPTLMRVFQRAAWRTPWPWIAVGLVGFSLLAWGLAQVFQRMERA